MLNKDFLFKAPSDCNCICKPEHLHTRLAWLCGDLASPEQVKLSRFSSLNGKRARACVCMGIHNLLGLIKEVRISKSSLRNGLGCLNNGSTVINHSSTRWWCKPASTFSTLTETWVRQHCKWWRVAIKHCENRHANGHPVEKGHRTGRNEDVLILEPNAACVLLE